MDDSKLSKEAPKLFSLKKQNVYLAPGGFFDKLEKDIQKQFSGKNKIRLRKIKKWIELSIAAAIILMVFFSGIKLLTDKSNVHEEANTHEHVNRTIHNLMDSDTDRD